MSVKSHVRSSIVDPRKKSPRPDHRTTSTRLFRLSDVLCLLTCSGILVIMSQSNENLHHMPSFAESLEQIVTTAYVLTAMTIGLFILTIIGLVSVIKDSPRVLTACSILLAIVFLGIVASSGYIYYKNSNKEEFALDQISSGNYNLETSFWDNLHRDFQCCGINGPKDWILFDKMPMSCCFSNLKDGVCTEHDAFRDGCYEPIKSILNKYRLITSSCLIGSGLVQLLVIFVTWKQELCKTNEKYTVLSTV